MEQTLLLHWQEGILSFLPRSPSSTFVFEGAWKDGVLSIHLDQPSTVAETMSYGSSADSMDLWKTPDIRVRGWYLSLMAPSVKGPHYAWLDPSRLYCHQQALQDCIEDLLQPFWTDQIDLVAGIDAMGFILGAAIANRLGKGFLAIRKSGHLCVPTISQTYVDYSGREKVMELRTDAIKPGMHVLLVDQWIETGGTMKAAVKLVEEQGGVVAGVATICIEDSEGGTWVRKNYKCSDCVPEHLRDQFNNHYLESFRNFTIQGEENGDGHFTPSIAIPGEEIGEKNTSCPVLPLTPY